MPRVILFVLAVFLLSLPADADVLTLKSGGTLEGEIVKETDTQVTLRTSLATVTLERKDIVAIEHKPFAPPQAKAGTNATGARGRLPDAAAIKKLLRENPWAKSIKQVPAVVLADGPTRNVPYLSFRAAEDYEINIYGDPAAPLAIEVALHNMLRHTDEPKQNARRFIASLLSTSEDKKLAESLDLATDHQVREGLIFEVKPHTDADAFGAWLIRVYDDRTMDLQRAEGKELDKITAPAYGMYRIPREFRRHEDPIPGGEPWTTDEMTYAKDRRDPKIPARVFVREYLRKDNAYIPSHAQSK